jgi:4-hydroxybutyrate CoA-transferase
MDWKDKYKEKFITAEEAAKLVKSGDRVSFSLFDQAQTFGLALAKRKDELRGVTLVANGWTENYPWFEPGWEDSFRIQTAFTTRQTREAVYDRRIEWIPAIFGINNADRIKAPERGGIYNGADVFVCKVTPPDEEGWCSFGNNVWYSPSGLRTAKLAIVEIDEKLPWCYGERINISELDYLIESNPPEDIEGSIDSIPVPSQHDFEMSQIIGAHVIGLINDGDTIEIGTGTPPESVASFLGTKNDLGLDTEMMWAPVVDLIKQGVITGKNKNVNKGKHITSCLFLYKGDPRNVDALSYVEENPAFQIRETAYVCDVPRIASNDNMIVINSLLSMDLLGQGNITHIGNNPLSGAGGQIDYVVGSHYSKGGKSISCILSTAKDGEQSRIIPRHPEGMVIMTPCQYVDYVVTEHGIVNINCKSAKERAEAIISIADPKFQPWLREEAKKMFSP